MGKTSVKSVNKYIAKAYDRINFVMPKGRKEEIVERGENAEYARGIRKKDSRYSRYQYPIITPNTIDYLYNCVFSGRAMMWNSFFINSLFA
jgi:hypothetical protein